MICRDTCTHGWVCGWMGGSVGQFLGSGQITKNLINLDLIEIIQFFLRIYDFLRHPQPMGGCVGGYLCQGVKGGSGEIINNLINLDIF